MAGSARPTGNFSVHNNRGGGSTENRKRKTENFSKQRASKVLGINCSPLTAHFNWGFHAHFCFRVIGV